MHTFCECEHVDKPGHSLNATGACRAVWVPGQDLAMPHLMSNCGSIFCHYTVRYTNVFACI